ncbi:glucuronate isomerase [Clostridium sp. USBA 49]|uniref:glucuronate isomerase n=1 Tax=Clostridium sp. USBA 49 TaxID=1881060 RepID=UPI00099A0FC5|nr:glucuronate isomerase [Clostridium sp. USBA 49]SKA74258.1 glucuronate isomerase [Clostridium sp. USBA 49]
MKKFMDENFLLSNDVAVKLYHNFAKKMPIIDYHCHLSPKEIYENKKIKNITEAWLYGDHYKWRIMRAYGVDEKYITGNAKDYEKFLIWAKVISMAIGNPLYHWTHLELQRYFGIYETLNEKTAPCIWEKVNTLLKSEDYSVRSLIKRSNVEVICTTDDPVDSLEYHIKLKEDKSFNVKVLPTFRPDKALNINNCDFREWIKLLEKVCSKKINNYIEFLESLEARARFFNAVGCKISDHGLESIPYMEASKEEVCSIFSKAINGEIVTKEEEEKYKTYTLKFLGSLYSKLGWAMQLHMNVTRNNNIKMYISIGSDTGYDAINDDNVAIKLTKLLNSLEMNNSLPKTILYTLNPKDNYVLATAMGCFQGNGVKGKIQFGAAWWFLDNKDGMIEQMKTLANVGLLNCFVGMLTDSRSFLSYTRHEYFRRILCNLIGTLVENGEYPNDMELLEKIVKDISYYNAKQYFLI